MVYFAIRGGMGASAGSIAPGCDADMVFANTSLFRRAGGGNVNATSTSDGTLGTAIEVRPAPAGAVPSEVRDDSVLSQADEGTHTDPRAGQPATNAPSATPPPAAGAPSHRRRRLLLWAGPTAALAVAGYLLVPTVETALSKVSTEYAYVNGHVTLVRPVPGQVARVLVNDNNRVKKSDLLVQFDHELYQVLVDIKQPAVIRAVADLALPLLEFRLEPIVMTIGYDRLEGEHLHGKHS